MCRSSSYRLSRSGAKDARINAQSDANVEENANQGPAGDVTADVRRRRWNGRRPGAAGAESFFQDASSAFEIGDVSKVTASRISSATTSAIERRRDAGERVKIVIAEIAIGAVGDGRQIGEFSRRRRLVMRWAGVIAIVTRGFGNGMRSCVIRPTIGWTD
jgi:hypothetical protein